MKLPRPSKKAELPPMLALSLKHTLSTPATINLFLIHQNGELLRNKKRVLHRAFTREL
jgi:hypothetical protein